MPEGKSLTVWCNYQFPRAGALGGPLRGPPNTPSRSQGTEPVLAKCHITEVHLSTIVGNSCTQLKECNCTVYQYCPVESKK